MTRSDVPYVILVAVFGLAIFVAGRMSAPDTQVIHEAAPPAAPSIFVITPPPEPPMALLSATTDELEEEPAPSAAKKQWLPPAPAASVASSSPVKMEPVFLEETPELPMNPYKKDH